MTREELLQNGDAADARSYWAERNPNATAPGLAVCEVMLLRARADAQALPSEVRVMALEALAGRTTEFSIDDSGRRDPI